MSETVRAGSSLQQEVAELVSGLPQMKRASKASRRIARTMVADMIANADPSHPLTVEQTRRNLDVIAEASLRADRTAKSKKVPQRILRDTQTAARVREGKSTRIGYPIRPGSNAVRRNTGVRVRVFKNPFRVEYQVVNLDKLAELYPTGGNVTVEDLIAKGAVRKNERVKVLGTSDISVKLKVSVDKVTSSAEQKIVAAGGSVEA